MFQVILLKRNGSTEKSRFFTGQTAKNYLHFSRQGGRFAGGAVENGLGRVADFGIMAGRNLKEAKKWLLAYVADGS